MKFQSGILGVIVVVIALMGTIFGGYLTNVHQENVTTTVYEPVTDVTSLFNFTQQPDYIEYNPAKNFTGYSLSNGSGTGINYTSSSNINQYYMSTTTASTITVDLSVLNNTTQIFSNATDYFSLYQGQAWGLRDSETTRSYGLGLWNPYFVDANNLYTYLSANNLIPANTTSITIHPKSGAMVGMSVTNSIDSSDRSSVAYARSPNYSDDQSAYGNTIQWYRPFNTIPTNSAMSQWLVDATPQQCYLSYDVEQGSWTLDVNGQQTSMPHGLITYPRDNKGVRTYGEILSQYFTFITHTDEFTLAPYNTLVDVIFTFEPVYDYMKPSDGVSINHNTILTTDWTNGKQIGDAKILFGNGGSPCSNTLTTSAGSQITVSYDGTNNYISLNGGTAINIGAWDHFVLDISPMNGKVTVIPVSVFNSYISYTTADYVFDIGTIPNTNITKISWNGTSSSYTFSVNSTTVQMSTKLLMLDAGLNPRQYFPLTDGYRLDINSFATFGTSMSVNGVTLYGDANQNPISDTNSVYYQGKSYKLNNIQILRDEVDGHTYINFLNDREKIDLGVSTTDVVFFAGLWYFNTFLDEGKIGSSVQYIWDWANSLTSIQSLVIFMALIVVFGLVANKFFNLGIVDLAIMIASIVILYAVSEVIM